jgi:hypothetical protein
MNDCDVDRGAAAAALWGGGIEVIEQEAIGLHSFTRHMLASDGNDEGEHDSDGDDDMVSRKQNAEGDDSDSGSDCDQRKSAQRKFAALQQQMLRAGDADASASQPKAHFDAVNMEELNGGLLDDSVRFWSDFQQVIHGSQRVLPADVRGFLRDSLHAERAPRAILLPLEHRPRAQ